MWVALRDGDVIAYSNSGGQINLTGVRAGIVERYRNGASAKSVVGVGLDALRADGCPTGISSRRVQMQNIDDRSSNGIWHVDDQRDFTSIDTSTIIECSKNVIRGGIASKINCRRGACAAISDRSTDSIATNVVERNALAIQIQMAAIAHAIAIDC